MIKILIVMRFLPVGLLAVSVSFACPTPQAVLDAVKSLNIPIKEVKKVEPYEELPLLCRAEGILEKDGMRVPVDFYTTADGKYFLPFVGRVVYQPTEVKGIKRVTIVSVRNSNHTFTLGYVTSDLRYYFPEMLPLKQKPAEGGEKVEKKPKGER